MAVVDRRTVSVASKLCIFLFLVVFIENGKAEILQLEFGVTATTMNATEGDPFNYKCNSTSITTYWQNASGGRYYNKTLSFIKISRIDAGLYSCYNADITPAVVVEEIIIEVLYPAKIFNVSAKSGPLNVGDVYTLQYKVEGNPAPETSFISVANGTAISQYNSSDTYIITIESVKCEDGGAYTLLASNSLAADSKTEEIRIQCAPSPSSVIIKSDVLKPRLGDNITISVFTTNYPYDNFTWTYAGVELNSTDKHFESHLNMPKFELNQFGNYSVSVANAQGETSHTINLEAYGPPDPVQNLTVTSVSPTSVNLSWVSGYDYGARQNFIIRSVKGSEHEDIDSFDEKTGSHGLRIVSHVVSNLETDVVYTIRVVANNSRGEADMSPTSIVFKTGRFQTKPIVEGNSLTAQCNSTKSGAFVFWVNAERSFRTNDGHLDILYVTRNYTNLYTCMEITNTTVTILETIFVDVQYPAKILNIAVGENKLNPKETYRIDLIVEGNPTPNVTFTNTRDGRTVYTENTTGKLTIKIESVTCDDTGTYTLVVMNKRANVNKQEDIMVYCPPVVDKSAHIKQEFYPRIAEMTTIKVENYGYPYPKYIWTFNQKNLPNHEDSDFQSVLNVNISADDFGDYMVDMENSYGNLSVSFHIIAAGPPDPVTNLKFDKCTYDSVTLSWISGFNYGSPQTFVVKRIQNGKETDFKKLIDFSKRGLEKGDYVLTGLDSSTSYNFTVYSVNKNGTSTGPQGVGTVQFQTADVPTKKSYAVSFIGGLICALAGVAILVGVRWYIKKRKTSRGYNTM